MQWSLGGITLKSKNICTGTGIPAALYQITVLTKPVQKTGFIFLEEKPAETS